MKTFLKDILSEKDLTYIDEILSFNLDPKTKIYDLQEKIAISDFLESKLARILFKLRFMLADLEVEFDVWKSNEMHNIPLDYDGLPELLKNQKDYEREMKRNSEFKATQTIIKQFNAIILTLEERQKNLINNQWKVKNIIELEKLKQSAII